MVSVRTPDEYARLLRTSRLPMLAQLEAPWCGECHSALPRLARIADTYRDRLVVLRTDVDSDRWVRERYAIEGYPTYLFSENGEVVATCLGEPDFGLDRLVRMLLP